jgi:hypothetical protein
MTSWSVTYRQTHSHNGLGKVGRQRLEGALLKQQWNPTTQQCVTMLP